MCIFNIVKMNYGFLGQFWSKNSMVDLVFSHLSTSSEKNRFFDMLIPTSFYIDWWSRECCIEPRKAPSGVVKNAKIDENCSNVIWNLYMIFL